MYNTKRLFRILFFIAFILCTYFVVNTISETLNYSDQTVHLGLDEGASDTITVNTEGKYTLFLTEMVENGDSLYVCDAMKYESVGRTEFHCDAIHSNKSIYFSISIESWGDYYYFNDMGNTTFITNSSEAIGQTTLPEGNYNITIHDVQSHDYVNVAKIESSVVFGNIFIIIFGTIAAIGLLIGYIFLFVVTRREKHKMSYHDDMYYESNMNRMDHNKDVFSDEDPFAKFDK